MGRSSRARPRTVRRRVRDGVEEPGGLPRLLVDVGLAANEARTAEAALAAAVSLTAQYHRWSVGHAWLQSDEDAAWLPARAWYVRPGLEPERFRACLSRATVRPGAGLIGYVLEAERPLWVADLAAEPRWIHDDGGLGLVSAVVHPVRAYGAVRAILEFYSDHTISREPALETAIGGVAFQVARVLERHEVARRTTLALEHEQRQIGRELHDRLGQSLSALGWLARGIRRSLETQAAPELAKLDELIGGIDGAKLELRRLAKGLMPLDPGIGGLPEALEDLATRCRALYGIDCRFEGGPAADLADRPKVAQLYRIAQEAIRNAVEHGHTTRVTVRLGGGGGELVLEVRDDGTGFDAGGATPGGTGIRIMGHRAELIGGRLEIESGPAGGTVVRCTVPVA